MVLNLIESVSEEFPSYSCLKVCEALNFLLDNIYIRFGSKLYRHTSHELLIDQKGFLPELSYTFSQYHN